MGRTPIPTGELKLLRGGGDADSYLTKLVKFVPVEGLAPFIPLAAQAGDNDTRLWTTFVVALVVGLVLIIAQSKDDPTVPRWWYWPFVVVAFVAWSVGASEPFRELLDVSADSGAWLLGLTALALPALDSGLEKIFPPK